MVERPCPVCGTVYEADPTRLKHGRQTTCSRKCSYSLRASSRSTSVTGPCAVCGEPVSRPPSKVAQSKTDALLCSRACAYQARSLGLVGREVTEPYKVPPETRAAQAERLVAQNAQRKAEGRYGHSEETKAKLSRIMAEAIAGGRIPRVSQAEQEVAPILEKLGIPFHPQHRMRGDKGRFAAVVDYFLPDRNTALEFNGTFWHADLRVYPHGPEHPSQKRTAAKYQRKRAFLAQQGITVAEVWELDFKENPEQAVRDALGL